MSDQALEKMTRDAAGNNGGLSSVQFAKMKGVGIEIVHRWKNNKEPMPSGWAFLGGKWIPETRESCAE
ncbi:hypothetical protein CDG76_35215 [Nostoc sp. 'Peltigera membranacea cyanobiont' 210A]|uniref:hypothetical protein n=1 Tax=Nostoc sp. 'Peltigera membranacea cyanobiont' 210A TaxID=2014529 RepID=UPI000B954D3C|nr:hypothetical protein [Nostoc sp. 'Peltigera membranacea cyanobiont' 210A]OYD89393.1 hypothetical protein CDG76_35215 [Nostoc sp. 'Peltigera membranacea cyanobiont' 210A]